MVIYESGCVGCESSLGCAGTSCSCRRIPIRICDGCGTPLLSAYGGRSRLNGTRFASIRTYGVVQQCINEEYVCFAEYEDFEEYEERRESSADNAVFPDKVTKRNNEYIFGEELRREKGEELCERCRAVRGRKKR